MQLALQWLPPGWLTVTRFGLAAVVAGYLDLVVALFVADLGARNAATVSLVERGALRWRVRSSASRFR